MDNNFNELVDMLQVYFECRKNSVQAVQLYRQRFPNRNAPYRRKFSKLERRLRETGSLRKVKKNRQLQDENLELNVLLSVEDKAETSVREIAQNVGASVSTVHSVLRQHKLRPYKVHLVQHLEDNDFLRRMEFANWFINKWRRNLQFPSTILWSDECTFSNNGMFNRNKHYRWSRENPRVIREGNFQRRFSVNVWCGMWGGNIVGPFFIDGTLTTEKYNHLLRNDLEDYLDNVPLLERQALIFQQDGAPAHNANINRTYLNETYGEKWIGTNGPIKWSPRSPDLSPLDFFCGVI